MSPDSSGHPHSVKDLEILFEETFYQQYRTRLISGAKEPLYMPSNVEKGRNDALIYSTLDYFSSALHEVSHWCIAGELRRKQEDYGYWYAPDGRDEKQQKAFEAVEVKPQAIEWMFSQAAGCRFRLSTDNINAENALPNDHFARSVCVQYRMYISNGIPARAKMFIKALRCFYGDNSVPLVLQPNLNELI